MSELAHRIENTALAMISDDELMTVLQSSLYPGANPSSIKMVLGYCKAAGLDPMQKPVHIVPMWDGKAKQMRDVVMPGVGLYRTQAARTGTFAGQTEPEFGPMVTQTLSGVEITFPEWARVTVKKLMRDGMVAEFSAVEYWIENYAVKGGQEKSIAPNAMWMKRPRGQIAKCAAAQALRLAFPEMGAQPTADEMEGKPLDPEEGGHAPAQPVAVAKPAPWPDDVFEQRLPEWHKAIAAGKATPDAIVAKAVTKHPLTDAQMAAIRNVPKPKADVTDATPKDLAPERTVSFAVVAQAMVQAFTLEELQAAGDMIGEVADAGQRAELTAKYHELKTKLEN